MKVGMSEIRLIFDDLYIEHMCNLTIPDWTRKLIDGKPFFPDHMEYLANLKLKLGTWTQPMKRLSSGPLIQDVLDRARKVERAVNLGNYTYAAMGPKMMMYSAHDSTIVG